MKNKEDMLQLTYFSSVFSRFNYRRSHSDFNRRSPSQFAIHVRLYVMLADFALTYARDGQVNDNVLNLLLSYLFEKFKYYFLAGKMVLTIF